MRNKCKWNIPIISKILENTRAKKSAKEILRKYPLYKTEDFIQRTYERNAEIRKHKNERNAEIKYFLSYVFLFPLSKIFKLLSFVARIGIVIGVFTFFVGLYDMIKVFTANDGSEEIVKIVFYLIAPFVMAFFSFAFSCLAEKCWED